MQSSNFLILLLAILMFLQFFFFFVRLQCHYIFVFSVFYQQNFLADYCTLFEKPAHNLGFFWRCLTFSFSKDTIVRCSFSSSINQNHDSFDVKKKQLKNQCGGNSSWVCFTLCMSHIRLCLFECKFTIFMELLFLLILQ